MSRTMRLPFVLLASAILWIPDAAHACSCMLVGPTCQAFWKAPVVFDGTVVSVVMDEYNEYGSDRVLTRRDKLVTLKVHRAWKGIDTDEVTVSTAEHDAACGYPFEEGRRYLVLAHHGTRGLGVSSCSGTKPFDGSGPDAAFLESLNRPAAGGRIFGEVRLHEQHVDWNTTPLRRLLDGVPVSLDGPNGRQETLSKEGRFEFRGLSAGTYAISAEVPSGFSRILAHSRLEIPDPHACFQVDLHTTSDGRIGGQVLHSDGRPAQEVSVEITSDAAPTEHGLRWFASVSTDASGFFEHQRLPPGRYSVGINMRGGFSQSSPYPTTLYRPSGTAEPEWIELARGEAVSLAPFILPLPPKEVVLVGTVWWPDGRPLVGGDVAAYDVTDGRRRIAVSAGTHNGGRFELKLREGRTYIIQASARDLESRRVVATSETQPMRLSTSSDPLWLVLQLR